MQFEFEYEGRAITLEYPDRPHTREMIQQVLSGTEYPVLPFIRPQTILDVGANIGCASLLWGILYPGARVFAFEPSPEIFEYLRRNTAIAPNVTAYNFGLSDRDEPARLFKNTQSVFAESDGGHEQVELRRGSEFIVQNRIDHIDILKIDTEGAEVPILKDLIALLPRVDVIYLEYHCERDRLEIDRVLCDLFTLALAKVTRPHLGILTYISNRILATQPEWDRQRIDRTQIQAG